MLGLIAEGYRALATGLILFDPDSRRILPFLRAPSSASESIRAQALATGASLLGPYILLRPEHVSESPQTIVVDTIRLADQAVSSLSGERPAWTAIPEALAYSSGSTFAMSILGFFAHAGSGGGARAGDGNDKSRS